MGRALADVADSAIAGARTIASPRLRSGAELLEIERRCPTPEQVRLARWYLEERDGPIDEREFTRRHSGHDYTFFEHGGYETRLVNSSRLVEDAGERMTAAALRVLAELHVTAAG